MVEYEIIKCPFCNKSDISCFYVRSAWTQKRMGRNALGRGVSFHKTKSELIVREGCKNCGKTKEDIQIWLNSR